MSYRACALFLSSADVFTQICCPGVHSMRLPGASVLHDPPGNDGSVKRYSLTLASAISMSFAVQFRSSAPPIPGVIPPASELSPIQAPPPLAGVTAPKRGTSDVLAQETWACVNLRYMTTTPTPPLPATLRKTPQFPLNSAVPPTSKDIVG